MIDLIVFISDPQLNPQISSQVKSNPIVLNFTSLYSGIAMDNIYALASHMYQINQSKLPAYEFVETLDYDMTFANAVFNNPDMYEAFMKIVIPSYEGNLVIILVSRDTYRDALMESLIKLIQQRYGYNCWIVNDFEDIESLQESIYSPEGLMYIQSDIDRYREMFAHGQVISPILSDVCIE